jgi:ATP-binding cassette subfamily G (WHITE) protein 2
VKGRLLAVMGASGSGKTTFLNQLSMRGQGVEMLAGQILIDGKSYSRHDIKHLSGYVLQDDVLFDKLTVKEVLTFAAELRMHPASTAIDKIRRISKLLKLMDLRECQDVIVGSPLLKGISGGQRKRLCVALELIARPSILFLDEPTSGLDSVNALALVSTLRGLAHKETVTVVMTVHQPSTRMFAMFDDVLILEHGAVMYQGPAESVVDFYASAGFPCPVRMNPAEWVLEVIADPEGREQIFRTPDGPSMDSQEEALQHMVDIQLDAKSDTIEPSSKTAALSWWRQFSILFQRSAKLNFRNKMLLIIQLTQTIIMGLLVGGVFFQLPNTQASITNRRAALFFCTINQGIFGALMTINIFPAERMVIMRERLAGMYPASAYFLAKCATEFVFQFIYPLLFSVIVYWMIGLATAPGPFFIFLAFMELCMFSANSVALLVSSIAGNVIMAAAALPLAIEIARLFGGYFMPPIGLPLYFAWIDAVSYVKYVYMAVTMNQFTGLAIGGCVSNSTCLSGNQVLSSLGIGYIPIYGCALVLIGLILVLRVATYIVLRVRP